MTSSFASLASLSADITAAREKKRPESIKFIPTWLEGLVLVGEELKRRGGAAALTKSRCAPMDRARAPALSCETTSAWNF